MNIAEFHIKFYLENSQHLYSLSNSDKIGNYLREQLEYYLNQIK
jgi:hypothetical protein